MPTRPSTVSTSPRALRQTLGVLAATIAIVWVGAGVAAAENAVPTTVAPASGMSSWWQVANDTDDAVWGDIYKQTGNFVSGIGWPPDLPVPAHGWAHTQQIDSLKSREYTWGRICYRGAWWNLPRDSYSGPNIRFYPEHSDANILKVSFNTPDGQFGREATLVKTPSDSGC